MHPTVAFVACPFFACSSFLLVTADFFRDVLLSSVVRNAIRQPMVLASLTSLIVHPSSPAAASVASMLHRLPKKEECSHVSASTRNVLSRWFYPHVQNIPFDHMTSTFPSIDKASSLQIHAPVVWRNDGVTQRPLHTQIFQLQSR